MSGAGRGRRLSKNLTAGREKECGRIEFRSADGAAEIMFLKLGAKRGRKLAEQVLFTSF